MKRTTSRLPWPNANSGTEERLRGVSAHERGDRGKPEFTVQLQSKRRFGWRYPAKSVRPAEARPRRGSVVQEPSGEIMFESRTNYDGSPSDSFSRRVKGTRA